MKNKRFEPKNYNSLLDRIANILVEARTKVVRGKELEGQVLKYQIYELVSSIKKLAHYKCGMQIAECGI